MKVPQVKMNSPPTGLSFLLGIGSLACGRLGAVFTGDPTSLACGNIFEFL